MDKLDGPDRTRPDTVDLAEAARRLGISVDAVRKRLKRGQVQGYKGEGGRWFIIMDAVIDTPGPEPDTGQTAPGPDQDALLEELRREVQRLERDLDWHKRMMAELVTRVPQLPVRATPAEEQTVNPSSTPEASDVARVVEETAPTPRPWWKVWRR